MLLDHSTISITEIGKFLLNINRKIKFVLNFIPSGISIPSAHVIADNASFFTRHFITHWPLGILSLGVYLHPPNTHPPPGMSSHWASHHPNLMTLPVTIKREIVDIIIYVLDAIKRVPDIVTT